MAAPEAPLGGLPPEDEASLVEVEAPVVEELSPEEAAADPEPSLPQEVAPEPDAEPSGEPEAPEEAAAAAESPPEPEARHEEGSAEARPKGLRRFRRKEGE